MSLVSIIIPVYNSEDFLMFSLKSAIKQTYKNKEIIVINDGTKDEDKIRYILSLYKKFPIRYFSLKKNMGVSSALNLGLKKSKGKYICWLSHDDIFMKNKITEQMKCLNNLKKTVIISSNFIQFNHISDRISEKPLPENYFENTTLSLMINDRLNGCSLLIPKIFFKKVGKFDKKLVHTQDYDMWIRLSRKFKFVNCAKYLLKMRVHKNQSSQTGKIDALKEKTELFKKYYGYIKKDIEKLSIKKFIYYEIILINKEMIYVAKKILNSYIKNKSILSAIFFKLFFQFLKITIKLSK